jgi:hypothetical protein
MQVYEIRVLGVGERNGATLFQATYASDFAAIRAAERIANGREFEVWRGIDCLYAKQHPTPVFPARGPSRPAA